MEADVHTSQTWRRGAMARRQKIRKGLILISFLFFPITIYYLSPVLIVAGAAKGVVTGSFIVFGLMFLVALVLGRVFCGWVCPGAGLQEACFSVRDKEVKKGNWINKICNLGALDKYNHLLLFQGGHHCQE